MKFPFRCNDIEIAATESQRKELWTYSMQLVGMSIFFYSACEHTPVKIPDFPFEFEPIPWLKPDEELLVQPLYETRTQ